MSHLQWAECPTCGHSVSTGWTEPGLAPRVFCGGCDADLALSPWDEGSALRPALATLFHAARAPVVVESRRGRVRRTPLGLVRGDSGVRVPFVDRLHESEPPRLVWAPDFAACACPACGAVGRIHTFGEALAGCPRCASGPMRLLDDDLPFSGR